MDNCDYNFASRTSCGDACIDQLGNCYCGDYTLSPFWDNYYCCVDNSPANGHQCYVDRKGHGHCTHGTVLSKTMPCSGHCFNDYSASEKIGHDSQFHCGNHCVPAWSLCRGYSQCEDRSDVAACDENLTCVANRGDKDTRHMKSGLLSDYHFYCDDGQRRNDGQYDTITREDETDIRREKVRIDYTSLDQCMDDRVSPGPGLWCGDQCFPNPAWCRVDGLSCDFPVGNFSTNNKRLCGNTTFWVKHTCDGFYPDGDKAALGQRCSGESQHCLLTWYLSNNFYYEVCEQLIRGCMYNILKFRPSSQGSLTPVMISQIGSSPSIRNARRKSMLRCTLTPSALVKLAKAMLTKEIAMT